MFRLRDAKQKLPPEINDEGKAKGFVHVCDQSALMFGSDRKEPVNYRPVVSVRRDGMRAVVLQCTTKDQSASPDFFELVNDKHVQWTKSWDGRRSFACCCYEVINGAHLRFKVGVMPQPARIEIFNWLKSRF